MGRAETEVARQFSRAVLTFATFLSNAKGRAEVLQKFEKIEFYSIFLDVSRARCARTKGLYCHLKLKGIALFQKKSLNLHMPGRTRQFLRRIPFGVPADFNLWGERRQKSPVSFIGLPQILICGKRRKHNHYICYEVT